MYLHRRETELLQPEDLNWYKSRHRKKITSSYPAGTQPELIAEHIRVPQQQQQHSIDNHTETETLSTDTDTAETQSNHAFDVVSFNLLAPVYKRLSSLNTITGRRHREDSDFTLWNDRLTQTIDFFRSEIYNDAAIIALQEYWLDPEYRILFETQFKQHGYKVYILQRTGEKMDAVAIAIKSDIFEVCGIENVHLCTYGDRVALLLWLKHRSTGFDLLVANTHLSFPHNTIDKINQVSQMKKLTSVIHEYASEHSISTAPALIMGDFNVESYSPVCDHLKSAGYYSCFEISPPVNTTSSSGGGSSSSGSNSSSNSSSSGGSSSNGSSTVPTTSTATTTAVATATEGLQDSELEVPNTTGRVVELSDSSIQQQQRSATQNSHTSHQYTEYNTEQTDKIQENCYYEDVGDNCIDSTEHAYISDTAQYTANEMNLLKEINMTEHHRQSVSYISHYNHRNESVGVDHIFIKPISINSNTLINPLYSNNNTNNTNTTSSSIWEMVVDNRQKTEKILPEPVESHPDRKNSELTPGSKEDEIIKIKERILNNINIYIAECQVLPKSVTCSVWDPEFNISDHRPVRTKIIFSQQSIVET